MGLLDEAIRDHLELKRRRGADPTEVAREEAEALKPVIPSEAPEDLPHGESPFGEPPPAELPPEQSYSGGTEGLGVESEIAYGGLHTPELSTTGQETVELDMQAMLDADAQTANADSHVLEEIPGQERLSFE